MHDFYITNENADGGVDMAQVSCGRDVVDFAVLKQSGGDSLCTDIDVLKDIVGALLERAAISPRDMLDLCGLHAFDVERY
jgi:hypothetical protein